MVELLEEVVMVQIHAREVVGARVVQVEYCMKKEGKLELEHLLKEVGVEAADVELTM